MGQRFIPTYVGHTTERHFRNQIGPVHPHIRGAYVEIEEVQELIFGSSPHTWGILGQTYLQSFSVRFIPTYVGHTLVHGLPSFLGPVHPHLRGAYALWGGPQPPPAVHPHLRGAYYLMPSRSSSAAGSSPPTWGIHSCNMYCQQSARFIPTYVGHTGEMMR